METNKLLTFPCMIGKVQTLADKTLKIDLYSKIEMDPIETAVILSMGGQMGHVAFKETSIKDDELTALPDSPVGPESSKTPAQRLRAVLYRLWQQQGSQGDYELYYNTAMNRLIDQVKDKLA